MALDTAAETTERIGGFTVAGVAKRDTDVDESRLWAALDDYADEITEIGVRDDYYGVLFDLDESGGEFTYVAGVAVESTDDLPAEWTGVEIPETTYAVFRPTVDTVEDVVTSLGDEDFGDRDHAPGPLFERFDADARPGRPDEPREFYVPVEED